MKKYQVSGMHCAACSQRVERVVSKIEGVTECSVSLLTNSLAVSGTADSEEIMKAVKKAGYGIKPENSSGSVLSNTSVIGSNQEVAKGEADDLLEDHETPKLKKRLIYSVGLLVILMYFTMGHMMWGFPVPSGLGENHLSMAIFQLLVSGLILVINQEFFIRGFKGIINLAPNMDSLVALGSMVSYLWSIYVTFLMSDGIKTASDEVMMKYMDSLYFESAAMILTLITVGKMLEAKSKGRTTDALKGLMKLAPKMARVLKDGVEKMTPVENVIMNDIFLIKPGENIPVDGIILEGNSAVNEAALTGESIPVDKAEGDEVFTGTINTNGFLKCQAVRVGQDTTLSQIIKLVKDTSATKAPIAKIADKVSGVFVPVVITLAVITTAVWIVLGAELSVALEHGISVLVISCPCALGLATPVAIMVGSGVGAKRGILFKTAVSLEETGRVKIVCLDKTGTVTEGKPVVTDIIPVENVTEEQLLKLALSIEAKSEHPLAKAILSKSQELNTEPFEVSEFKALSGNGLEAKLEGKELVGGSFKFIETKVNLSDETKLKYEELATEGKTPMFFAYDNKYLGMIAVSDVIKSDSKDAVSALNNMGIEVVMITGDNEKTAKAIGKAAGIENVISGVLPNEKEKAIRQLMKKGKVAMVGDGINDAPALTRADVGIAIGQGASVAIDSADVVLMKSSLMDSAYAILLSRATLRNIHQNLFWAFFYNSIGIPLAMGVFSFIGLSLNPMFAAMAMSLSSFSVVTNALRLNRFKFKI